MTWKHAAMIVAVVIAIFSAAYIGAKMSDPGYDVERAEILRIAYSHPDITSRVGSVSSASFVTKKKEGLAVLMRYFRDDWTRVRDEGVTKGSARVFILGSKEGGIFVIHYTFHEKNGGFALESVDTSPFDSPQGSRSRASQTTTGLRPVVSDC